MTAIILTKEQHQQIVGTLETACVCSCNCLTKTHEEKYHSTTCPYGVCREVISLLRSLEPQEPVMYVGLNNKKPRFYKEGETLPKQTYPLYAPKEQP